MAFKIIREDEPLPVRNIMVVIFGQPGLGKTSLSFTAKHPILLDFDQGVERAVGRKLTVKFDNWRDTKEFVRSRDFDELKPSTLIMDTGGTMLDNFIADYVVDENQANGKKGGGVSLQGYGAVKENFSKFMRDCRRKNVDVVVVCHVAEDKEGDNHIFKPKMTGGSYDILLSEADLVGYMEMESDRITLDFNPTSRHKGKNMSEFPKMDIPHYSKPEYKTFLADLIQQTKDKMSAMSQAQLEAIEKVKELTGRILEAKHLDDMEAIEAEIISLSPMYQLQVREPYEKRFVELWVDKWITDKVTTADDFNALIDITNDLAPVVKKSTKLALMEHAKQRGVVVDKATKSFVDDVEAQARMKAEKEAEAKKSAKKAPAKKEEPAQVKQEEVLEPEQEEVPQEEEQLQAAAPDVKRMQTSGQVASQPTSLFK